MPSSIYIGQQPRAIIVAEVITPVVQRDPTLADMLVRYLDHALAESTYDGSIAGKHALSIHGHGPLPHSTTDTPSLYNVSV